MMRDPRTGRFINRRAHTYRLTFDDGAVEYVTALTPSDAVRARTTLMLPHTITDETALKAWADGLGKREGIHTTPMLDRIYGPGELYQGPSVDDGWDRPVKDFTGGAS